MRFYSGLTCLTLLLAQGCYLDWPDRLLRRDSQVTDGSELDLPVKDGAPGYDADGLSPCFGQICPTGCNVQEKRCYRLKPSNIDPASFFDQVTAGISITGSQAEIDTDTGEIKVGTSVVRPAGNQGKVDKGIYWGVVSQGTGYPELSVFGVDTFGVHSNGTVTVKGKRALAIYSTNDVTLSGIVTAAAKDREPGAGGFQGGSGDGGDAASCLGGGGEGGGQNTFSDSGGGGGGRKAKGGKGGDTTWLPAVNGGAGGSASGNDTLVPLFGGCGGGGGGGGDGGDGGGGGGAIQISANGEVTIDKPGAINVAGAGGKGSSSATGGGGGGSGGAILLEGLSVKILGLVTANGGGGGAGGGSPGEDGQDGQAAVISALGGKSSGGNSGAGGNGGAQNPEEGQPGQNDAYNGGGGGGAAGRIRINATSHTVGVTNACPASSFSTSIGMW